MKALPAFSGDLLRCVSLSSNNVTPNQTSNVLLESLLLRRPTPIPTRHKQETMKRGEGGVQDEYDEG